MLLLGGEFELDSPRLEEQLADGSRRRIDIGVGATVIEVKRTLVDGAADDEIAQLAGYVQTRVQQTGGRYNGILTNGRIWGLFEFDPATDALPRPSICALSPIARAADLIAHWPRRHLPPTRPTSWPRCSRCWSSCGTWARWPHVRSPARWLVRSRRWPPMPTGRRCGCRRPP